MLTPRIRLTVLLAMLICSLLTMVRPGISWSQLLRERAASRSSAAPANKSQRMKLVEAAKVQIGVTLRYDSSYQKISYPGGDVPLNGGVCSDVIIRAYRALGVDLQTLIHQDMSQAWDAYPHLWQLRSTDTNIDHRRVPNLARFFTRHGQTFSTDQEPREYLAGDIVTWRLRSGVPHIGIVSDQVSISGIPLVIHNIGRGTLMENSLFDFVITGHYRYGLEI